MKMLLILRAQDLDLRDIGHLQQARSRGLHVVAQFALKLKPSEVKP
jgi:hypothetical protein